MAESGIVRMNGPPERMVEGALDSGSFRTHIGDTALVWPCSYALTRHFCSPELEC